MSRVLVVTGLLVLSACRVEVGAPRVRQQAADTQPTGRVTVYTSMYRHVIDAMKPILAEALPEVEVEWLQGGSEKLATRLDAELTAGTPSADLVMTSDPLWYRRLAEERHLAAFAPIPALAMPRTLVDPRGYFVTSRISTMVLAYNEEHVKPDEVPRTFLDLFDERFVGRVTTPDPLGSGTTFTTLAFLVHTHGEDVMQRMKAVNTIASGGNSSTLTRLESGEHHVGFVLLENVLAAEKRGTPVKWKLPEEGAVIIPGPIALLAKGPNPVAARAVYEVLLSKAAQEKIVDGLMHAPFDTLEPPTGAPPLPKLLDTKYQWTDDFVHAAVDQSQTLREKFSAIMGGH
ncbi:MAG: extracellular solute-binding protein [Deltaproteobacteria bacterium]